MRFGALNCQFTYFSSDTLVVLAKPYVIVSGSIAIFVSPISSVIVGIIIDSFGRKAALLYSILPSIAGWALQYYSSSMPIILLGQVFNGLTIGSVSYPVQVYAGECIMISSIRLRNSFMMWIAVGTSLATTLMLLLGSFLTYHDICGICTVFSILLLVTFALVIPESPTWLYHRGRIGDAEWSQRRLGIAQPILHSELEPSIQPEELKWSTVMQNFKKITRRDVYIPAIRLSIFAIIYELSGEVSASTYMLNIIDDTIPGTLKSEEKLNETTVHFSESAKYSFICGIAMCIGSVLSSFVLPWLGLKAGFIFSSIGNVVGLVALTYSSTIQSSETALTVRIAAVTLLSFLMSITLGPMIAASGDIFPLDAKGFASLPDVAGYLAAAISNKLFPYLYYFLVGYAYLVFAVISIIGAIYVYFFLPEVVGKTLEEIHEEFKTVRNGSATSGCAG